MRIAVVGATGLVGQLMLRVLEEVQVPVTELIPAASQKSIGKKVLFNKEEFTVVGIEDAISQRPDAVLFSAGGGTSLAYAERFSANGSYVIDNSSAWRMHDAVPLVVPEINPHQVLQEHRIIANPNCSTIQLVMALAPIHEKFGLKKIVVSTYQSVTGSGKAAVDQLEGEAQHKKDVLKVYPYPIFNNVIPQCDSFLDNGYTKEEWKLMNEPKKIMGLPDLQITATAVRVPSTGGHSESVFVECEKPISIKEIREILSNSPGIKLMDAPDELLYPMPYTAQGKNEVQVGRIREDMHNKNAFHCWIVADNLRKGAATNTIQILQLLHSKGFIGT